MSTTPPRQQTPLTQDSPVRGKSVHLSHGYQTNLLADARQAVLDDLGPHIPMISFDTFLDRLAPPQPKYDLDATMQSLKSGSQPALTSLNRWSKFPKAPKDFQDIEDKVFSPIPEIFIKVVVATIANSGGTLKDKRNVDFLQNPNRTPTSTEIHNDNRPDGYLVLKNRNKVISKDGKNEDICWTDIALSCEYKRKDGNDEIDDDVRKCLWSLQHVMRTDWRRRASFGITIENSTTRVWFCCRSFVIVSESFDFIYEPEKLVKLFAAFAFADEKSLGFDPTIQPDPDNKGQFIITVHPDNDKQNPRRFRITKIMSSYGAEPLRGRGTRVFEAIEIDIDGNSNGSPPVVLKDIWIDSDRVREGNILTSLHAAADNNDKPSVEKHFLTTICQGDVWTEPNILDDTENALMRGLNITPDHNSVFELQRGPIIQNREPPAGSDALRAMSYVRAAHPHIKYEHKTHYRIVFKEICTTIDLLTNFDDVLTVLSETASALRLLRKLGYVHRDVSIGNILSYNGHAKLADLEYAKKIGDLKSHEMRTGTMHFMSIEVDAQDFLFDSYRNGKVSSTNFKGYLSSKGTARGKESFQSQVSFSHNHLHDLESLWWVALWVVFYNYFSEGTPSGDHSSFTLQDVEKHLNLARTLFPPTLDSAIRQNTFQRANLFWKACRQLPNDKMAICEGLDYLRQYLIEQYTVIEANYPESVDPNYSDDEIYGAYTDVFSQLKTESPNWVLDFIPRIKKTLLNKEKQKEKRARSESTNDTTGDARKSQKK